MKRVNGSCLCRGVEWEVTEPMELMGHCHCSMCRKAHGSAFATYVATPRKGYQLLQGAKFIARYESSPNHYRHFCSICGSCLPVADSTSERIFMPAGCLDDDPETRPLAHLFVGSKAPWHEITDELPRFDTYPPNLGMPSVEREVVQAEQPGWARGSCLCGEVAYEVKQGPAVARNCHCSRCRKARAAAYASNLFVEVDRFHWLHGKEAIRSYKVPEAKMFTHYFCQTCGSSMPRDGAKQVFIPMGSLDDDPKQGPQMHIFCKFKAPWFEISDDLPQYAEYPE